MERSEALAKLNELLALVCDYEKAVQATDEIKEHIDNLRSAPQARLAAFDAEHKEAFIKEKIGEKPVPPSEWFLLLLPVYLIQKANYDEAIKKYNKLARGAEEEYCVHFSLERTELLAQDNAEKEASISMEQEKLNEAENLCKAAKSRLDSNDLFAEELKKANIIRAIISYLNNKRADTLKEAVNLWFDEKRKDEEEQRAEAYRKEMLELEGERVRAAEEAEEYAEMQYYEAQETKRYAREAAESAKEATQNALYNSYNNEDN